MRGFASMFGGLGVALAVIAVLGVTDVLEPPIIAVALGILALTLVVVGAVVWTVPAAQQTDSDSIGGYRLVELLGKGGMGEVWRAEHKSLSRPAAVKVLRAELLQSLAPRDRDELEQRFRREVQLTATLSSPHTVAVFDYGQTPEKQPYYVMELLHGVDLEYLVDSYGPQPAERVVYWLRQVCSSLAEAHHRKLIHRDIKPANIYVCAIGMDVDFAKVLDFGLVRDLEVNQRLTVEGATPGTPSYLSPESLDDKNDPRSDLYALGCVAYWLLTGRLVFDAETRPAMLAAHRNEQPLPPSRRTELPIPKELEAIVMALLAKDPAARPANATVLAKSLAAVPLTTAWTADRAEAWWQGHLPSVLAESRAK